MFRVNPENPTELQEDPMACEFVEDYKNVIPKSKILYNEWGPTNTKRFKLIVKE